ncbi:uncharacterized protein N7506_005747 [Penicillium brevicompactum]|uniref:uncharacterized protein n=1 Tax=Penicillium brevicompactum TaxID=5074 RepID=UPI0025425350|nr:uncharacterized protein N7506_005747 [Penicillium brevicompactum]KAJ5335811.1 hypothetical protein N7506_005747 [Penicillium brevicompactum]
MPEPESPSVDLPEGKYAEIDSSGSLRHLSLKTPSETLSTLNHLPQPHFIENLARDVIRPQLEGLRQGRWFEVENLHALHESAREFQKKWNVPETSFQNFCALLSGCLYFRSILLLNPSPLDYLPFDEMLEESPTLLWLQEVLRPKNLTIRDIILFDTIPMAIYDFIDRMSEENQPNFAFEAFHLTLLCLGHIQPQILISCQRGTQPSNDRWGLLNNAVARSLCSSVSNARARRVRTVHVESHPIHVVQGFHPNYEVKMMQSNAGLDLDNVLQNPFQRGFQPFEDWKSERDAIEREMQESATLVRTGL